MEALGLEKTDSSVCKRCKFRFLCYTNRGTLNNGLCNPDNFMKLDDATIHIDKAKKQGRYFPTNAGQPARRWGKYIGGPVGNNECS